MGCCGSSDAAGDNNKKGKKGAAKGSVGPDVVAKGNDDVKFIRQVKKALYGPEDTEKGAAVDVTEKVRAAISEGTMLVTNGITSVIGTDLFPGVEGAFVFQAWYFSEKPDFSCEDFEVVKLEKDVALATYGLEENPRDITKQLRALFADGKTDFIGGIHTALKEPLPSDPNVLNIWWA